MQKPIKYKKRKKRANRSAMALTVAAIVAVLAALVVGIIVIVKIVDSRKPVPAPPPVETEADETEEVTEPIETEPEETEEVTEPIVRPEGVSSIENYRAGTIDLAAVRTEEELDAAAKALKSSGYTAAVLTVKQKNGTVPYASAVADAAKYGAVGGDMTPAKIVSVLHKNGLFVTARMHCFLDNTAASANPGAALLNAGGKPWSDGTSRWLSAYSADACDYLLSLVKEWDAAGADEISLAEFYLPSAADSHLIRYPDDDHDKAVSAFLSSVSDAVTEADVTLEASPSALIAGKNVVTGFDPASQKAYAALFVADCRDGGVSGFARTAAETFTLRPMTEAPVSKEDAKLFCGEQITPAE